MKHSTLRSCNEMLLIIGSIAKKLVPSHCKLRWDSSVTIVSDYRLDNRGSILDSKVAGSNPAEALDFKGSKNPQHTFVRMVTKSGCPMS
jgi:hypothetical protein